MQWKVPKNSGKYQWTAHVADKMRFYGLSEQKVLGVIRRPQRIETGIADNTVAVMVPVGNLQKASKAKWGRVNFPQAEPEEGAEEKNVWNQEIWVMYQTTKQKAANEKKGEFKDNPVLRKLSAAINSNQKITIISAWRYPGVSPEKNPIPEEIWREIEEMGLV